MSKRVTFEEFITRANLKHNGIYDYSKVEWINIKTKICIICQKHGEFYQTPHNHLNGQGCPECGHNRTIEHQRGTKDEFVKRAREVHGYKYDYSKVEYNGASTKICIICPEHGEFWQTPNAHLNGKGCQKCYGNNKMTTEEFIEKARKIHGYKYDYSKVEYKGNNKTKVCIICPEHGEFWQRPNDHLSGASCKLCNCHNHTKDFEDFEVKAKKIHMNKYSYNEYTYINRANKTKIICPEH